MLDSPEFWVAVGFVILLAGVGQKIWKALTGALDRRAGAIKSRLDEAATLRDDAQELFAEYQRKQRAALQDVDEIVSRARDEASRMMTEGEANLALSLKRREDASIERIAQAQAEAMAQIRVAAAELTVATVRRILTERLDPGRADGLIETAIEELPKRLN